MLLVAVTTTILGSALRTPPTHVSGFAVDVVNTPISGHMYTTLQVSSDPDVDGLLSITHPDHPQMRVHTELHDAHGVLGVWPSSIVAARQVAALSPPPQALLELGAGCGLPSLVAAVHHSAPHVLATDLEQLPLDLLRAVWDCYAPQKQASTALETQTLDVRHGLTPVLEPRMRGGVAFDTIVAADMLYDADVAQAVGAELGDVVARSMAAGQSIRLVVCDPGRRCREDFLDAFRAASNLETARFDDVDVVEVGERDGEAGSCETESPPPRDIFDGSPQVAVGVLTWS